MIEFALALPFLVILVLGTIDGGRLYATWNRAKTAAREGAQYAQRFPTQQASGTGVGVDCTDPNNIIARARNEGSDLTITVSPAVSPSCQTFTAAAGVLPGDTISVTATAPFNFMTPFAKSLWGNPSVKATAKITVQG